MGSTFSTIQIRNPIPGDSVHLKEQLCKYYLKKGLVPTIEENAQFSFWIAFSDSSNWAALGSGSGWYDLDVVHLDIPELAKEFHTHCVVTGVWDSDTFDIELFGPSDTQHDVIRAGRSPFEGHLTEGHRELWEPLFALGKTWEQLREICNRDYTFSEEALCEIAPLLGIDPKHVTCNYDCCKGISTSTPNVIDLHFKVPNHSLTNVVDFNQFNKNTKQLSRKPSLEAAIIQEFSEALAIFGFVKIKGSQPYFVRLVDDEILHIMTYQCEDNYEFSVLCGVNTVYRYRLTLDESPRFNCNWLEYISGIYMMSNPFDYDKDFLKSLLCFTCTKETMIEVVNYVFELTSEIILPVLDKVVDFDKCLEFFYKYKGSAFIYDDVEKFAIKDKVNSDNEGLLYIKTGTYGFHMIKRREMHLASIAYKIKNGIRAYFIDSDGNHQDYTQEIFEEHCRVFENEKAQKLVDYNQIYSNHEYCSKAFAELERRKTANTNILRSYGLLE